MEKVTRKITVDLSRKTNARVVFATQNDLNSRRLLITLTDDGKPYAAHKRLTATVNYKRSDGKYGCYLAGICDDGKIEYLISPTILIAAGQTLCTVSLFNDIGDKLTSSPFVIEVAETLYPEYELSEDPRLDYVDEMIAKFTSFQNDENARKQAEIVREESELDRGTEEANRRKAEKARAEAEIAREQGEAARKSSEVARVAAEIARAEKMAQIAEEEKLRVSTEIDRVWAENQRDYEERVRAAAEQERRTAEYSRQVAYHNLDKALDVVLSIQNTLIGGDN